LVCGASDIASMLDLCLCLFVLSDLFSCFFWVDFVAFEVFFIINDLVYFIDWNIITLNGRSTSIIITFLFD
jgi:hypothetical protein